MTRIVQVLAVALGACIAVKVLAWLVTPALPVLVGVFIVAVVAWLVFHRS